MATDHVNFAFQYKLGKFSSVLKSLIYIHYNFEIYDTNVQLNDKLN